MPRGRTRILECRGCGACLVEAPGGVDVAEITQEVLRQLGAVSDSYLLRAPVGVSMRHVHMTRRVMEALFGEGYRLRKLRDLKQPGEFASQETVAVVGPRMKALENVRVLGPLRNYTQVELSRTDGIFLGVDPPIRDSGDLKGSSRLTLVGPKGSVELKEGGIRATRHLHITSDQARHHGLRDGQYVKARIGGERSLVLDWILVRAKSSAALELRLDTDDANAAGVRCAHVAEIVS